MIGNPSFYGWRRAECLMLPSKVVILWHRPMSQRRRKLDAFIDDVRTRQRNIVFPDTLRGGRSVDAFLWKGSPNPSLVQRIAARVLGFLFVISGLMFLRFVATVRDEDGSWIGSWIIVLISASLVFAGIRIFRNGFPRRNKPTTGSN